jgi:hypothetical protein
VVKAECERCQLQFNDPTGKYPSGRFTCWRCRETAPEVTGTEVTIGVLMEDEAFRQCLLAELGVPNVDYSRVFARVSNKLFYQPVPVAPSHSLIRVKGLLPLDGAELVRRAAALVCEGKRETSECLLCFRDVVREDVVPACGRPDCQGVACRGCLRRWYGSIRPGEVVCLSTLQCPFCRRLPTLKTMDTFNRRALAIAGQVEQFDPAYHYAWCSGQCYKIVPAVEKECRSEPPNYRGAYLCENCRTSKLRIATEAITKLTPCCQVRCEKVGGCDHITCRCGAHFCWQCLKVLDAEEIYSHIAGHTGMYQ